MPLHNGRCMWPQAGCICGTVSPRPRRPRLFLDMDGVLMNFEGAIERHGVPRYRDGLHWIARPRDEWPEAMVVADKAYVACMAKHNFWDSIRPMPDAHMLWHHCRTLDPYVLTAAPSDRPGDTTFAGLRELISKQKRDSIHLNFDPTFPADNIHVCLRHEKALFAEGPECILVDDTPGNCQEWIKAGGTAILHVDAISTIRRLQELYHV